MNNLQKIPWQVKKEKLYDHLNLYQLIMLSKINKRSNEILRPIITKKEKNLFLRNYSQLFENLFPPQIDPFVINNIYKSYGNKYLFFDFLFTFFKIRIKSKTLFETYMIQLEKLFLSCPKLYFLFVEFQNSNILKKFYQSLRL